MMSCRCRNSESFCVQLWQEADTDPSMHMVPGQGGDIRVQIVHHAENREALVSVSVMPLV